ncbi:MAG: SOS response-associated peptidase [Flavobacterium sp.]|nr:MAG: SOS response-associated peptidase [Flavobacterium sp.]
MCGRVIVQSGKVVNWYKKKYGDDPESTVEDNANICPTDSLSVITNKEPRKLQFFRWGLIPSSTRDLSNLPLMFNARAETLLEKTSFRNLVKSKRCIVIVTGWYEWGGKPKQQYVFNIKDREELIFAGLWDEWYNQETGKTIKSVSIITVASNDLVAQYHEKERQPAILAIDNEVDEWLADGRKDEEYIDMLKIFPSDEMEVKPVGEPKPDKAPKPSKPEKPKPPSLFDF